ncbi:MAG: hypothetical protein ACYDC1_08165 [Limisphaerales bacterium]
MKPPPEEDSSQKPRPPLQKRAAAKAPVRKRRPPPPTESTESPAEMVVEVPVPPPATNPATAEEALRLLVDSPLRMALILVRMTIKDRQRLSMLESPDSAIVLEALRSWRVHRPPQLLDFERWLEGETKGFQPDRLWLAWMTHVQGDRLRQIGQELLREAYEPQAAMGKFNETMGNLSPLESAGEATPA